MAWRIADDELAERQAAEEWLKREDPFAFQLRDEIMRQYGIYAYMCIHFPFLFCIYAYLFVYLHMFR
jgi:hypothetical protein